MLDQPNGDFQVCVMLEKLQAEELCQAKELCAGVFTNTFVSHFRSVYCLPCFPPVIYHIQVLLIIRILFGRSPTLLRFKTERSEIGLHVTLAVP